MTEATTSTLPWRALSLTVLAVAALVVAWKLLPLEAWVEAFLGAISGMGLFGPVAYGLVYVVVALLGVPRTPLNIGAGIVFSFPVALTVVLLGASLTFFLSFEIARHLASEWVERRIKRVPKAQAIMEAVEEEGFKLVLLLRMNPFVPAVVKGYGFGTTALPTRTYMTASVLGFLPIAIAHVALGWLGGATMMNAAAQPVAWRSGLLIAGAILSVALVVFVSWFANRALHRRTPRKVDT